MGGCVLTFWSCLSGTRRGVGYEAPRYLCSRKPFKSVQDFCWDCRSAAFTTEKAICLAFHVLLLFLTSEILQMASYENIFLAFFHVHVMLIVCHCLWSVPLQGSWWSRMRSDCSPIWGGRNWPSLGRLGYGAMGWNDESTQRTLLGSWEICRHRTDSRRLVDVQHNETEKPNFARAMFNAGISMS